MYHFFMKRRGSGILLHVTSLPSNYGIGDLGPWAYRFTDFLSESKQSFWQILPLNPTNLAFGSSPYSSPSAFAGNPLLIRRGFPAKAEGLLYGELPKARLVGFKGSICQKLCLDSERKSVNL